VLLIKSDFRFKKMSNNSHRYLYVKSLVPINEYSWNPTARYFIHPKSKYGGYALRFQALIDRAVLNSDKDILRRLMTTEPDFVELDKLRNDSLKSEVLRSIRRREKSVYGITIPDRTRDIPSNVEGQNIIPVDIFSRTSIVMRVAGRRETRPHVINFVEQNFNRELELARSIL